MSRNTAFAVLTLIVGNIFHIGCDELPPQGQLIKPPMVRSWTTILGDTSDIIGISEGRVYYQAGGTVGAVSIQTGEIVWTHRLGTYVSNAVLGDRAVYAVVGTEKTSTLIALNLQTGDQKKLATVPSTISALTSSGTEIYALTSDLNLLAVSGINGEVLRESKLGKGDGRRLMLATMAVVDGCVICLSEATGATGIDSETGKVLWSHKLPYVYLNPPIAFGTKVLLEAQGLKMFEARTGKEVWQSDWSIENYGIIGDTMLAEVEEEFVGIDLLTGKKLWSLSGADTGFTMGGSQKNNVSDSSGVWFSNKNFLRITKEGKVDWKTGIFFAGLPIFADATHMITNASGRLLCYVPGDFPALPIGEGDRKVLAERIVRDYELMDDREREQLVSLAQFGTQPLIRRYVEWAKRSASERSDDGLSTYDLIMKSLPLLDRMCSKGDSVALLQAIQDLGIANSYRGELVELLGRRGDPEVAMPVFVETLRKAIGKPELEAREDSTVNAVARSSQPMAVAFMIEVLQNPKAPNEWRQLAFTHLAGVGGDAGIEAVRAARPRRVPLPKWEARVEIAKLRPRSVISEMRDGKGQLWRLFSSGVLGNGSDLFFAQKTKTGWSVPVFTGLFTERTWSVEPPKVYKGIPIEKLIKSEWIKLFPTDAALRRDSDSDGLSDVAEARLGTDLKKADTDTDGLKDSVDPCPNAAPRNLTDREKIIAACVQARFFAENWGVPATIEVKGIKPFEIIGYRNPLLWEVDGKESALQLMYNTGVNTISFSPFMKEGDRGKRSDDWLEIAPDGKSAKTMISRYSGGLNGDGQNVKLIKVGEDWFVTDIVTVLVS